MSNTDNRDVEFSVDQKFLSLTSVINGHNQIFKATSINV